MMFQCTECVAFAFVDNKLPPMRRLQRIQDNLDGMLSLSSPGLSTLNTQLSTLDSPLSTPNP